jgi:hypothetical protein
LLWVIAPVLLLGLAAVVPVLILATLCSSGWRSAAGAASPRIAAASPRIWWRR